MTGLSLLLQLRCPMDGRAWHTSIGILIFWLPVKKNKPRIENQAGRRPATRTGSCTFCLESHSTMKTPTTRMHTHTLWIHVRKLYPYEHLPPRADPCVDAKHLIAPVRQSRNLPQGKHKHSSKSIMNRTGNFTGLNWSCIMCMQWIFFLPLHISLRKA